MGRRNRSNNGGVDATEEIEESRGLGKKFRLYGCQGTRGSFNGKARPTSCALPLTATCLLLIHLLTFTVTSPIGSQLMFLVE